MTMRPLIALATALLAVSPALAGEPRVCFTPEEDCTGQLVAEIGKARRSVLVQAYLFSVTPIAQALVDAKARGIDVRAILDKSTLADKHSGADLLAHGGVPVLIDAVHNVAHNKLTIIDEETVVGGSFNLIKTAQTKNAENMTFFTDRAFAARFVENWRRHAEHADPYQGRAQ